MNIKTINFKDLNNDTLKNIVKFNYNDCDKLVINYKFFTEEELSKKLISLTNVLGFYFKVFVEIEPEDYVCKTDDEKYWIDIKKTDGGCEFINNTDIILDIICFLNYIISDNNEYLNDYLYEYFIEQIDNHYGFRKRFGCDFPTKLNFDMEIEPNQVF